MARPPAESALCRIDPDALAAHVVERVLDHVSRIGLGLLAPGIDVTVAGFEPGRRQTYIPASTAIGLAVRCLAYYARDGIALDAPVHEYLVSLIPLWSAPLGEAPTDDLVVTDPDDATPLGVVMIAALAREAIGRGHTISARDLATLASVTRRQIDRLVEAGEIRARRDGEIAADEARRFLAARGVGGFRA